MATECSCKKCVQACQEQPGWFAPGEAEKAAELIGMDFEEFKKFLIKDHCDNPSAPRAPYIYAPRKVGVDLPNQEIRTRENQKKKGPCVFLKNNRCSIHQAKPYECREVFACDYKGYHLRDVLESMWIVDQAPLGMRPE